MVVLGVADFGNIMAEFAGLASGMGIFGVSKYLVVPVGAAIVWFVVVRGSYKPVERILIVASLLYFRRREGWRKLRVVSFAYPIIPVLFIAVGLWMTFQGILQQPFIALAAALTIATGALFYRFRIYGRKI
jgi:hypothetical protein